MFDCRIFAIPHCSAMAFLNYPYLVSQAQAILKEQKNVPRGLASLLAWLTLKLNELLALLSCHLKHKPSMSQVLITYKQSGEFIECLVDAVEYVVEKIWYQHTSLGRTKRLLLRAFVRETIKTSRVFYSTVMISLLYIYRIQPLLTSEVSVQSAYKTLRQDATTYDSSSEIKSPLFSSEEKISDDYPMEIQDCSTHVRTALVGALMAASKYHQEHAPTNSDWARYTSLDLTEVTKVELAFLHCSHHRLFVSVSEYERWSLGLMQEINQEQTFSEKFHQVLPPSPSTELDLSSLLRNSYPRSMPGSLEESIRSQITTFFKKPQKDSYKGKRGLYSSRGPTHRSNRSPTMPLACKKTYLRYCYSEESRNVLNSERTFLLK
ncbi:PHO85 cyclin-5 [Basidiobolus ranarum]|uniref:PHO85 cyclin-5 n=1 Tax=Basidiobolus ranarum TaxID=34480 RepID=A0ABR2WRQ2_9FUNG